MHRSIPTLIFGYLLLILPNLSIAQKINQTITFPEIPNQQSGYSYELNATASSGLPVTYTISNPEVAILNNYLDFYWLTPLRYGTTIITAYQKGNDFYNEAPPVERRLVINVAGDDPKPFAVAPNPANNIITVFMPNDGKTRRVLIVDPYGEKYAEQITIEDRIQFDVSGLSSGQYYILFNDTDYLSLIKR